MPPYQRPPLSKKYLMGEIDAEQLLLYPREFYVDQDVDLILGAQLLEIDVTRQCVRLADGRQIAWDRMLLATGAQPRQLPGNMTADINCCHTLRSIADVDRMAPDFVEGRRLLIVGGGYIGLEAAAAARHLRLDVILIEAAPRILQRVAAAETSEFFASLHRQKGVDLREGVALTGLMRADDGRCTVHLDDNSELTVDFIIAGIGVTPATALAEAAGLAIDNGIATDAQCQTSHPNIFAAGDCASFPWRGRRIRLESVQNAIEHGKAAAMNMLGGNVGYDPIPWFWSDQYDVKLQIAGLNHGFEHTVTRPGMRDGARSVWYYRAGELLAVDAFNDAPAFMTAKQLLTAGISPALEIIADPSIHLKSLIRR
jgi:3-phenylpropionate/trans-cinnamate dioxygenase ferredoxin reductase subunit